MKIDRKQTRGGFTLVEVLIGAGLSGLVFAIAFSIFFALQKGFLLSTTWSAGRVNQIRLMDTLAMDLRAADAVKGTAGPVVTGGTANVLPLTIYMPQRYSNYESSGFRAGDPEVGGTLGIPAFDVYGRLSYSGTIAITYESGTAGNGNVFVTRKVAWNNGNNTASRTIAEFSTNVDIQFLADTGVVLTGTDTVQKPLPKQIAISVTPVGTVEPGSGKLITPMRDRPYLRQVQKSK